ncbi:hypothetical protein Anas_10881, partial [Armadillidium nasatum]
RKDTGSEEVETEKRSKYPGSEEDKKNRRKDTGSEEDETKTGGKILVVRKLKQKRGSADCSVVEQLVTAVGIPTGSTLPPPSPQIEQNLSKHNPECALSESRSTETGIKIINSRYNKCDVCDLQTKSTEFFIQHLFKEHIRKIITKPKRNKSLSLKPTKHWPRNLLLLLLQF